MIDTTPLQSYFQSAEVQESIVAGSKITGSILAVLLILEAMSYDTAKAVYMKDKSLYLQGLSMNFVNHVLIGIPIYVLSSSFLMRKDETNTTPLVIASQVLAILVIHSICFYELHKTFHTCPGYYKYHKFHHRYNTHTPPSASAAVSVVEYLLGYMGPFALSGLVLRPYTTAFHWSVFIIAAGNIIEHTPMFEEWSAKYWPSWLVNVQNHLEHHRKLNVHFAAPTFDIDWVVEKLTPSPPEQQEK